MWNALEKHFLYESYIYPWRQMRDTIEGSIAVKRSNILYLPIPSSFLELEPSTPSFQNTGTNQLKSKHDNVPIQYVPWHHANPAYSAYLQRARFPDITANALRAMLGVATKTEPFIELPKKLSYLEENVSESGESLIEFFSYCVSEVMSVGKINIVVDIDPNTKKFYLTTYNAEANPNWDYVRFKGSYIVNAASFYEGSVYDDDYGNDVLSYEKRYSDETGKEEIVCVKYKKQKEDEIILLSHQGKPFSRVPVFPIGSIENIPDPQVIPLFGISDIAISIYQENADLRQAHYLTCNPTLFIYGVGDKETPKVVGSQVIIGIKNPQARSEYPATDTSALEHIRSYIGDLYSEAASYGALFLSHGGQKESGEALNIRQANRGANIVHVINMVSKGINDALNFIGEMTGAGESIFEGNTEFAEMILNAQDINSLVAAWLSGAIDHDTLLNNLRDAGYVDGEKTNEQIKNKIDLDPPLGSGDEETNPNDEDENKKKKKDSNNGEAEE